MLNNRDYYNEVYTNNKKRVIDPLYVYQRWYRIFNPQRGGKLLDIGCGNGLFLSVCRGLVLFGIDISDVAIDQAKQLLPTAILEVGDAKYLPFDSKEFDYVTCLGSLEHFGNLETAMSEMIRVAKDTAKFMIIVPNSNYIWDKWNKKSGTPQPDETLKTYEQWTKLFNRFNLKVIKVKQDIYPRQSVKIFGSKNLNTFIRRIVYKLVWLFMPLRSTYQFIFILKRDD